MLFRSPREVPGDQLRRAPTKRAPAPLPLAIEAASRPAPRPVVQMEPVSGEDWLLRARLSDRVRRKLERARELASHAIPDGSWEAVLEAALDTYISVQEKRRAARAERPPKRSRPPHHTQTIPAEIRRAV